nr:hypothetical protein [Lactiplantibacillus sp. C232]
NYRSATKNIVSDHAQGTGKRTDGQSFEVVSQSEKQRVTNVLRKSLNLKAATTGEKFANQNYPSDLMIRVVTTCCDVSAN